MALVAGPFVACHAPAPVLLDLAAARDQAALHTETSRVDFGAPAARRHVLEGWSRDETGADGTTFVWGLGPVSTLRLDLLGRRQIDLSLRGWPFSPPGAEPQTVELVFNGRSRAHWTLEPGAAIYSTSIPEEGIRVGDNHVELRYARYASPAQLVPGSSDPRPLGVAWDSLEVTSAPPVTRPTEAAEGRLDIGLGTGLSYTFRARPGAVLEIGGIEVRGGKSPSLLHARLMGALDAGAHEFGAPAKNLRWSLPVSREGLVVLRLDAVWRGSPPAPGATLRLSSPVVRGPQASAPPRGQASSGHPQSARPPNLLLYVIDTLRADRLGCYGHPGGLTPSIDAFARQALLFERAYAASSWTKTSMATILTGLPPRSHGAQRREDALPPSVTTLAERLRTSGYDTAAFVTNPNLASAFGFDQGFLKYEYLAEAKPGEGHARSDVLHARVTRWLEERTGPRPFFLYAHSMDPHDPYVDPGERRPGGAQSAAIPDPGRIGSSGFMRALEQGRVSGSPALREQLLRLYEAEVRFNDASFGRLMDRLTERGLAEDTLVVLLSDHGEEFAEHGWWRHGKTLYEEQLRVPLVLRLPGGRFAGRRVPDAARHVDVVPTILDVLGLPPDAALPGRSLLALEEGPAAEENPVCAYLDVDGRSLESVAFAGRKLVRYLSYDRPRPAEELFALDRDPGETRPLAGGSGPELPFLRALVENPRLAGRPIPGKTVTIDPELEERLRAVGYIR